MKKFKAIAAALMMAGCLVLGLSGQQVDNSKLVATWDVEVTAEGQSYYLTMVLTETNGALGGTVSEQNGIFTDVALSSLNYDGQNLTFEFNSPTPPDGMQRLLQVSFSWAGDALDGSVTIPDLGMTVPAKATKRA